MMVDSRVILLHDLPVGRSARVHAFHLEGAERRRLFDLGLVPGTLVESRIASPLGDPIAYRVRGSVIAIRKRQAEQIEVIPCEN